MNFSDTFKQNGQLCRFSPDGIYLANAVQYRLLVREVKTLQIAQLYTCLDAIEYIEWSADSQFILCAMYKRALIQVWSLEQTDWTCKIDEGSAGLVDVCWSPDSRHILTTADFHLRITVWSLVNKSVSYIKHPKPCTRGLAFSPDGKFLALAERRDCKDYISLFDCVCWQLVKHFEVDTEDLAGIQFAPDSRVLCVWESCLQYKVLLYSLDGRCQSSYSAYEMALGVKVVTWSPTSQFLAVGSYDEKLRLLNHVTWKLISELSHPSSISDTSNILIYHEITKKAPLLKGEILPPASLSQNSSSQYEIVTGPVQIPTVKPDLNKPNPKVGVSIASFSSNCRYLCTKNDNMPNVLWIWDVTKLRLTAVLVQLAPIGTFSLFVTDRLGAVRAGALDCSEFGTEKSPMHLRLDTFNETGTVEWDPHQSRLALCTGTNKIYMWSPKGSLSVQIPCEASFTAVDVKWHPDGHALLVMSRDQMCVCFLSDGDDVGC